MIQYICKLRQQTCKRLSKWCFTLNGSIHKTLPCISAERQSGVACWLHNILIFFIRKAHLVALPSCTFNNAFLLPIFLSLCCTVGKFLTSLKLIEENSKETAQPLYVNDCAFVLWCVFIQTWSSPAIFLYRFPWNLPYTVNLEGFDLTVS